MLGRISVNIGQMFSSARWCAESINQPCRLTVNSTVEDQKREPFDFVSASYLLLPIDDFYTLIIYANGYIVFVFPFVRPCVFSFVR